jgi:GMP reductase
MKYEFIEIEDIYYENYDGLVYDLEVEDDHSYNIEGIIVHNSACTTRKVTGVGYPQISAAIENADFAHGLGALICLDGGMRTPGDVAKSFCANADMVMIGGMFAGTDECDGNIITHYEHDGTYNIKKYREEEYVDKHTVASGCNSYIQIPEYEPNIVEKKYKIFYGMSSTLAANTHFNGDKDYIASEGLISEIPCKGSVNIIIKNILGGLRSCCTYIGASKLKDAGKCSAFILVNSQHKDI